MNTTCFGTPVTLVDYVFAKGVLSLASKKLAEAMKQGNLIFAEISILNRAISMGEVAAADSGLVLIEDSSWAVQGEISVLRMEIATARFTIELYDSSRLARAS